ncbi:transposase [Streptomyces globosus]|uniref:transposase n=1 Tax=Streptomyces globosus TaxID=68209 RepID=UPI00381B8612
MIRRHELSDAEWDLIRPLLPRPVLGRPRLDDRTVLNGIVWKFRTGVPWRDVPERYGPWTSLHTRFRRWAADGTFERMDGVPRSGVTDLGWEVRRSCALACINCWRMLPQNGAGHHATVLGELSVRSKGVPGGLVPA